MSINDIFVIGTLIKVFRYIYSKKFFRLINFRNVEKTLSQFFLIFWISLSLLE